MNIIPLTPICNLRVCANVPFDSTYTDTINFGSLSAQATYFANKAKYSYSNLTPIRLQNKIRLPLNADDLYDCNYVAFQNTNFGNKWFYAFISEINYIAPSTAEIAVELDVIQTWMFDYTIKPSYVIREHPNSDNVGEHLLIEPLEVGEYVNERSLRSGHMQDYEVVAEFANTNEPGDGQRGGIFTSMSCEHGIMGQPSGNAVLDFLQSMTNDNRADSVVATYIMPHEFFTQEEDVVEINLTVPKEQESLGDYVPRNKKLLCYPYNFLQVTNTMGDVKNYRYEYWDNLGSTGIFTMSCPVCPSPEVMLFPRSYNGQNNNFDETISLSGFPQFAYIIDTYRAWSAQNGNLFAWQTLTGALQGVNALASGNMTGAITSGIGLVSSAIQLVENTQLANRARGGTNGNVRTALRALDFYFTQRHIREDYAKILDDYFDMYGYLTNRVKVPNITGRPSWNYVKTLEAKIVGSIPFQDMDKIKTIFNNGITFWHGDYVGDYTRNNGVSNG